MNRTKSLYCIGFYRRFGDFSQIIVGKRYGVWAPLSSGILCGKAGFLTRQLEVSGSARDLRSEALFQKI
ncbi:MAG: hypothetical protein ACKO9Q_11030, partial [Pirellula sp.]